MIAFGVPRLLHIVVRDVHWTKALAHGEMGPEISPTLTAFTGKPYAAGEKNKSSPLLIHTKKSHRTMAAMCSKQKDTLKHLSWNKCLNISVLINVLFCAYLGFHSKHKPERQVYEFLRCKSMGLSYCHFFGSFTCGFCFSPSVSLLV